MAGFELQETLVRLRFEDPSFDGLEVVCSVVPIGELTAAASLANVDPTNIQTEDLAKVDQLIDTFASALREWNLTRRGRPVPAIHRGVKSLDLVFSMQLIAAWLTGAAEVLAKEAAESMSADQVAASLTSEAL